ncbi:DUF86 domain-containing protein [Brevundimonas sp.]|uniref:HepT-like ribonuclease domain-containing protein n=1 Tax=Brevundimonas sp. TaxID=1871086 RepID=UPI003569B5EE
MTPLLSDPNDAAFVFEMHRSLEDIAALVADRVPQAFLSDRAKPHALATHFLTLGEAANRISRETWALYPQIEWQRIANLRHLIAHEYRKIDHAELWKIATTDAPGLARALPKPPPPADIL